MQKEPSEAIQSNIEAFYSIWENSFREILSINYMDNLRSLCKLDQSQVDNGNKIFQSGIEEAMKVLKKQLKSLSEKYNFAKVMGDSMEALNFNLLIAELLAMPNLPFTEEELMGLPYNGIEQEAYLDKLQELERLTASAKTTEEMNTKVI